MIWPSGNPPRFQERGPLLFTDEIPKAPREAVTDRISQSILCRNEMKISNNPGKSLYPEHLPSPSFAAFSFCTRSVSLGISGYGESGYIVFPLQIRCSQNAARLNCLFLPSPSAPPVEWQVTDRFPFESHSFQNLIMSTLSEFIVSLQPASSHHPVCAHSKR